MQRGLELKHAITMKIQVSDTAFQTYFLLKEDNKMSLDVSPKVKKRYVTKSFPLQKRPPAFHLFYLLYKISYN